MSLIAGFFVFIKEWWHVLMGVLGGFWYIISHINRKIDGFKDSISEDHVTRKEFGEYQKIIVSDVEECRMDLLGEFKLLLQEHEQDEFSKAEAFAQTNALAHEILLKRTDRLADAQDRVESKIDHLKDILLEKHL